jgi:hypothetical protein
MYGDFLVFSPESFSAPVAPFYAGLVYSAGALAATHNLLKRILGNFSGRQPEPELTQMEKDPKVSIGDGTHDNWRNMYGPPKNCKKNQNDENSLRKCIRPLSGE